MTRCPHYSILRKVIGAINKFNSSQVLLATSENVYGIVSFLTAHKINAGIKGTDMGKFKQNGISNSAFGTCCAQAQILKIKH